MFSTPKFDSYEHIYSGDPALDKEHPDFNHEAWVDAGDDKHLPCKEGARPVRFVLRRLKPHERDLVANTAQSRGPQRTAHMLIALALQEIRPFRVDGSDIELERDYLDDHGVSIVCSRHMEIIRALDNDSCAKELVIRIQREEYGDPKS